MKRKHTLIIGGTRGTGREVARMFVAAGHVVSVIGRQPPSVGSPCVHHWPADLLNEGLLLSTLDEIVHKHGNLCSLVFCQRYRGQSDSWKGDFQTSLTATKIVIEHLVDSFSEEGDKSIAIIASVAGQFIACEQDAAYHVAKAGLIQLARHFAVVLGPKGIRVNCVSPNTMIKEESKEFYKQQPKLTALYRRITPLGRMGTTKEVASTVEFLCGPKASFITGQNLIVDGGLSLQWHESLARQITSLDALPVTQPTRTKQK